MLKWQMESVAVVLIVRKCTLKSNSCIADAHPCHWKSLLSAAHNYCEVKIHGTIYHLLGHYSCLYRLVGVERLLLSLLSG